MSGGGVRLAYDTVIARKRPAVAVSVLVTIVCNRYRRSALLLFPRCERAQPPRCFAFWSVVSGTLKMAPCQMNHDMMVVSYLA
jgi:hypothetical protein